MTVRARHASDGPSPARWPPAEDTLRLRSIDGRTADEPLRVVVEDQAHVTARHEFLLHPDDPLSKGFLLR